MARTVIVFPLNKENSRWARLRPHCAQRQTRWPRPPAQSVEGRSDAPRVPGCPSSASERPPRQTVSCGTPGTPACPGGCRPRQDAFAADRADSRTFTTLHCAVFRADAGLVLAALTPVAPAATSLLQETPLTFVFTSLPRHYPIGHGRFSCGRCLSS